MYQQALNPRPYTKLPLLPSGLGCVECGGTCGGLGLFDAGLMNWQAYGWQEWGTVILGGALLASVMFSGKQGYRRRKNTSRLRKRLLE